MTNYKERYNNLVSKLKHIKETARYPDDIAGGFWDLMEELEKLENFDRFHDFDAEDFERYIQEAVKKIDFIEDTIERKLGYFIERKVEDLIKRKAEDLIEPKVEDLIERVREYLTECRIKDLVERELKGFPEYKVEKYNQEE